MNGALLIILVVALSGLIAYLGDHIGRKAGKKRISIFGLRPKYSSIIITVLTGVLIAALSISILLVTYGSLRQALFNINQVLGRLENLNRQLETKDDELSVMKTEIEDKGQELQELTESKNRLELELDVTRAEYRLVRKHLDEASEDISILEEERDQLNKLLVSLEEERDQLEGKLSNLNQEIAVLEDEYEVLWDNARVLSDLYSLYRDSYTAMREEDLIYQKGEIVFSDVLKSGGTEEEIIARLDNFLQAANREIASRPVMIDQESGMAFIVQQNDLFNVASILYNLEEGKRIIVRLVARVNVSEGDWLLVDFLDLIEDRVVFEKETLIMEKEIDGSSSLKEIESELTQLLSEINEKAIREGLLYDPQGKVGNLSFSDYYQILNEIDSKDRSVIVGVYATEEIRRQDLLETGNIEFKITDVGE